MLINRLAAKLVESEQYVPVNVEQVVVPVVTIRQHQSTPGPPWWPPTLSPIRLNKTTERKVLILEKVRHLLLDEDDWWKLYCRWKH